MTEFFLALSAFLAAHLIPASPRLRASLINRIGRRTYLAAYSLLSVILLGWLIVAAQRADSVPLWAPATWQWHLAIAAMPVATFLLVAGLLAPNPLSISLGGDSKPGTITSVTRHPVLWAFLIWALAHIPPNGDLVRVILFGGMALFSLLGFFLLDAKAKKRLGPERWSILSRQTSIIPFGAILDGRAVPARLRSLALAVLIAALLYSWFLLDGHTRLIGVDPLAGL